MRRPPAELIQIFGLKSEPGSLNKVVVDSGSSSQ